MYLSDWRWLVETLTFNDHGQWLPGPSNVVGFPSYSQKLNVVCPVVIVPVVERELVKNVLRCHRFLGG